MENQPTPTPAPSVKDANLYAALSYVLGLITGIFFFLISKDKYVRFHAMQSIVLSVVLAVVSYILGRVPGIGGMIDSLFSLAALVLYIVLIIKAYKGEKYKLPVIGDFAEKQA